MTVNTVGKYSDSQLPTFFFLGIAPDSITSSNKCIFLIQTSILCLPGNLGSCQAPKPANDDEMALLQSGRGFSLCSLPRLYLGGPAPGGRALENRAGSDWRCLGSDSTRMLPPGGCRDSHWPSQHPHRTCHTEDRRVSGPTGHGGQFHPRTAPQLQSTRAPVTTCTCGETNPVPSWTASLVPQEPSALRCSSLNYKWVHSRCSFGLEYSFPASLPGLPLGPHPPGTLP